MTNPRVGVIGVGGIAEVAHLPGYRNAGASVHAVCTPNPERITHLIEEYAIPHVYSDHRQLLERSDIDAVSVCVPTHLHASIVTDALNAGKHVLCEKPPGISSAEAMQMERAAQQSERVLCYALSARFGPAARKLHRFAQTGYFGEIYAARTGWLRRRGNPAGWFTRKEHSGGGALIDLGIHGLDLAWWLMGCPRPIAANGATYQKFGNYQSDDATTPDPVMQRHLKKQPKTQFDVEDSAFAFVRFENGAHLMLEASWALNCRDERRYVTLYGTRSGAEMSPQAAELYSDIDGTLVDSTPHIPAAQGYLEQLRHFVAVIQGTEEPIAPSSHGVMLMQMLEAIYRSAEDGQEIRIS